MAITCQYSINKRRHHHFPLVTLSRSMMIGYLFFLNSLQPDIGALAIFPLCPRVSDIASKENTCATQRNGGFAGIIFAAAR